MAFLFAFPSWFIGFIGPALAPAVGSIPAPGPPPSLVWLVLPLLAAVGGWAFAVLGTRVHYPLTALRRAWVKRLYVLFWNKLYLDEVYDAYFVMPNLRVARALNGKVEHAIVDADPESPGVNVDGRSVLAVAGARGEGGRPRRQR